MKVWITCFIVLFGASELFQWFRQFSLPLPVFILGGAFLAIASNYDKLTNLPFHPDYEEPESTPKETPTVPPPQVNQAPQSPIVIKRIINPVSFEIRKPFRPGD